MKRLLTGITTLALCLSLTACGGKDAAPFDPAADAEALLASGAFSEALTQIDQDTACLLYGLEADTVTGCAVYGSTGATAEELAIFTLTDEDAAKTALAALQTRVEDRKEALATYLPNELTKLDGAVAQQRGASVLLAIAADYAPVTAFLEG